ncbi:amidinotransferase [Mucilaginibacter robiniae]|uniref:Amidinotransferase n=2 Tax=Mucilaginibacter robiniae TaxID=2728022 RepID=A0A7L5EDI1_9SPHI|nr:amidinotransferase [Mucilaginibacter robiniae]
MIRPASFGFNEQTAASNAFQNKDAEQQHVQHKALQEFDAFVQLLRDNQVDVIVINDTEEPAKPDAVFPNNWVTFHENGDVLLYPIQAENRRWERREDLIRKLEDQYHINHTIDLSRFELQNKFLEGTGSMVLDRENKIAYACLSPRTHTEVLDTFCQHLKYTAVTFNATDAKQQPIYHTNVMMCVGSSYVVICLESVTDSSEKENLVNSFQNTDKQIIEISLAQMSQFAGNMLEVQNQFGENILVMSNTALEALTPEQKQALEQHVKILSTNLETIESNGGGSARCMMAEVFLPKTEQ